MKHAHSRSLTGAIAIGTIYSTDGKPNEGQRCTGVAGIFDTLLVRQLVPLNWAIAQHVVGARFFFLLMVLFLPGIQPAKCQMLQMHLDGLSPAVAFGKQS